MAVSYNVGNLDLVPGYSLPIVMHCSFADSGTIAKFVLHNKGDMFYPPAGTSAIIRGVRADGANWGPYDVSISEATVSVPLNTTITGFEGGGLAEITLYFADGTIIGTMNFGIMIEPAAWANHINYSNDVSVFYSLFIYCREKIANANAAADRANNAANEAVSKATKAAEDAVPEAVSDWLSKNVSAGTSTAVDKSLTVSGSAADSKTVGDKISALEKAKTQDDSDDLENDAQHAYLNSEIDRTQKHNDEQDNEIEFLKDWYEQTKDLFQIVSEDLFDPSGESLLDPSGEQLQIQYTRIITDSDLSISDVPADGKATGDRIRAIESLNFTQNTRLSNIENLNSKEEDRITSLESRETETETLDKEQSEVIDSHSKEDLRQAAMDDYLSSRIKDLESCCETVKKELSDALSLLTIYGTAHNNSISLLAPDGSELLAPDGSTLLIA